MFATRLGAMLFLLLPAPYLIHGQQRSSVSDLIAQFQNENVFWRQFELAQAIAAAHDVSVLPALEPWLAHEDRHFRGNTAYVFARLGDSRGFRVIVGILGDRSEKREVQKISSTGAPWIQGQIAEDRYYAAHLLGDLRDSRAIPTLVSLLKDPEVRDIVPWSLVQIGDRSAIAPLIGSTGDPDPSMRVLAIAALADLKAVEALPRLRQLLSDDARSNFGKRESVAEAAQAAIAKLAIGSGG